LTASARAFAALLLASAFTSVTLGALASACSSDDGAPAATSDAAGSIDAGPLDAALADADADAAPLVAPTPTFPTVKNRGGAVIAAPKVVAITFADDPMADAIADFTTKISASTYWSALGQEYGVGPMTPRAPFVAAESAPTTTNVGAIESWLAGQLSGSTPALGAPDPDTLYAVYYPATTTIVPSTVTSEAGNGCKGTGPYHAEMNVGGVQVGYAVLPRCGTFDDLTVSASHEYFEWATNPFPSTKPAFAKIDDAHWAWQAAFNGELGDLCPYLDNARLRVRVSGFQVETMWSNAASLAGKFPCAPSSGAPYVQAIAAADDRAKVPSLLPNVPDVTTNAIRIPPGGSRTVAVLVYSDQPVDDVVSLRALTFQELTTGMTGGAEATGYGYSLEPSTAHVGDVVALTIHAPPTKRYDLLVMGAQTSAGSINYWPVLVLNEAAAPAP
jgi:hypothetical protein